MALEGLDFRYEKSEEAKETKYIKCIRYSRKGHGVKVFLSVL